MTRKKELILVSHCVLNQNSVISGWERAQGGFNNIIKPLLEKNIGIIQLPCPELFHLGSSRPPMTKEEYDTVKYRKLCGQLADNQLKILTEYINNDYKIIGLIGIGNSPTCDTSGKQGIFMEIFLQKCNDNNIEINSVDIPRDYIEGETQFDLSSFFG